MPGVISYYATTPHRYPFQSFLDVWHPDLAASASAVGYSQLDLAAVPTPGLHVLTDFERMTPDELRLVARLRARLQRRGHRVMGNPGTWSDRHTLLARLHEAGINDFRAWRVDELGRHVRFPVFLRWADRHTGAIGEPIGDRRELRRRLDRLSRRHPEERVARQLLVVERLDVRSADGLFRKYSVVRVGDRHVPRHILFGDHWVTKGPKIVTPATLAEEQRFLDEPADLDVITRVFALAGIEFGRVDWGYLGSRPQIWEINTNPMLAPVSRASDPRDASQLVQAQLLREALESLLPDERARRRAWIGWRERRRWQPVVASGTALDAERR